MQLSSSDKELFMESFYVLMLAFCFHPYEFLCRIVVLEVAETESNTLFAVFHLVLWYYS